VGQSTDAATARADWAQEQARAQDALKQSLPAGVSLSFKIDDTPTITGADRAALATFKDSVQGMTISGSAVYLLKGPVFLSFSDLALGHSTPTASAMEAQATTSLGRVP